MRNHKLKNAACTDFAAAITLSGTCAMIPSVSAETSSETLKYEFENGTTSGGTIP